MHDQRKARLARSAGRYLARTGELPPDDPAFDEAFESVRDAVVRPIFDEVAATLRASGLDPRVELDDADERPSVFLVLGTTPDPRCDRVGFSVIRRRGVREVLAYLVVSPPPTDLRRYAHPTELVADHVEQLTVDAVDHILACRAAKRHK